MDGFASEEDLLAEINEMGYKITEKEIRSLKRGRFSIGFLLILIFILFEFTM